MESADEVNNITGFTIGGVSPIGHQNKIKIFIDNSLSRCDPIKPVEPVNKSFFTKLFN